MGVNVGVTADVPRLGWKVSDGLMGVLPLTIRAFGFIGSQVALTASISRCPVATNNARPQTAIERTHNLENRRVRPVGLMLG